MASTITKLELLYQSVCLNELSSVKTLLEDAKANLNLGRKEWECSKDPLHWAAYTGSDEIVQLLVETGGFDVNSTSVYYNGTVCTSLHCAVSNNKPSTVRLLLALGADLTIQGNSECYIAAQAPMRTPLDLARKMDRREITAMIEDHAARTRTKNSFDAMDTLAKLMQKPEKLKDLEEAGRIHAEIVEKEAQKRKLTQKMEKAAEERRRDEKKLESLEKDLHWLKDQENYRNMEMLKKQLAEIRETSGTLAEVLREGKVTCPVCFVPPQKFFACQECHIWVCQDCEDGLSACPTCEQDLAASPMKRCKTAEMILGIK